VQSEFDRSERLAKRWRGPVLNVCGRLSPRESAALIGKAIAFVGHDSGPMHLAASVGTPCVAIFSAQDKPGVWFPFGTRNRVLYHQTDCYGCLLQVCIARKKECIRSITVEQVVNALVEVAAGVNLQRTYPIRFAVTPSHGGPDSCAV